MAMLDKMDESIFPNVRRYLQSGFDNGYGAGLRDGGGDEALTYKEALLALNWGTSGAASALWLQIQADILEREVRVCSVKEQTFRRALQAVVQANQ